LKKDIHPEYKEATVTCACGNVIHTRSTKSDIRVEICSSCHPFFTGKQKLVDTAGRVERFRRKYGLEESPAQEPAGEAVTDAQNETAGKKADAGRTNGKEEQPEPSEGEQPEAASSQQANEDQ